MKNITLSTNKTEIDNDIIYYDYKNLESKKVYMNYETEKSFIQFHFCLKGDISFEYNNGAYAFPLQQGNLILLYNPIMNLPVNALLNHNTKLISLLIRIEKFHMNSFKIASKTVKEKPDLAKKIIYWFQKVNYMNLGLSILKLIEVVI